MTARQPLQELDPSVIAAAQAGDEQAHATIYSHYANRLFSLIYRLVQRRAQAEDLLQEVFIEVLRNVSAYSGAGSFGGWLHSIAINKSLSYLRSPWHRGMLWMEEVLDSKDSELSTPAQDVTLSMQRELEAALRQLSSVSRVVVWLHDVEGYTHAEIGRLLGRTASFSKSQLARAHLRLRESLVANDLPCHAYDETVSCTPATQSLQINS